MRVRDNVLLDKSLCRCSTQGGIRELNQFFSLRITLSIPKPVTDQKKLGKCVISFHENEDGSFLLDFSVQ